MRTLFVLSVALVAAFVGAGSGAAPGRAATSAPAQSCSLKVVRLGQEFSIVLSSDPNSASTWDIESAPDPHVIEHVGPVARYEPPAHRRGEMRLDRFQFRAAGLGVTVVAFSYERPADRETSALPAQERFYVVQVR